MALHRLFSLLGTVGCVPPGTSHGTEHRCLLYCGGLLPLFSMRVKLLLSCLRAQPGTGMLPPR